MYLKSPAMMLGYLDNPEATAEMIGEDGWLKTGDIGYREQGKYYVIGRIKVRYPFCGKPCSTPITYSAPGPHQSSGMASRASRN